MIGRLLWNGVVVMQILAIASRHRFYGSSFRGKIADKVLTWD
jgi:hypothetical protein